MARFPMPRLDLAVGHMGLAVAQGEAGQRIPALFPQKILSRGPTIIVPGFSWNFQEVKHLLVGEDGRVLAGEDGEGHGDAVQQSPQRVLGFRHFLGKQVNGLGQTIDLVAACLTRRPPALASGPKRNRGAGFDPLGQSNGQDHPCPRHENRNKYPHPEHVGNRGDNQWHS